jgi:hypothetical protein
MPISVHGVSDDPFRNGEECFLLRASGSGLDDNVKYCFRVWLLNELRPRYIAAMRNLDGEDLMKMDLNDGVKPVDAAWRYYMATVPLTIEQVKHMTSVFGRFIDGKFVQLSQDWADPKDKEKVDEPQPPANATDSHV